MELSSSQGVFNRVGYGMHHNVFNTLIITGIWNIEFIAKGVCNMIIYRPHRGSLIEFMSEAKEFKNEEQMKSYIVKHYIGYISTDDIVIDDEIVNDDRNGWKDTRYVCIKRMGNEDYICPQCIGMCATDFK